MNKEEFKKLTNSIIDCAHQLSPPKKLPDEPFRAYLQGGDDMVENILELLKQWEPEEVVR